MKGGILTADICVLDDISRAPGEALNVLLRLLNERRWTDGEGIPLVSAIATANPAREDYFNEPLDPANLDRFTLQVQASGLVHRKDWQDAARVVEAFGTFRQANGEPANVARFVLPHPGPFFTDAPQVLRCKCR